MWPLVPQGRRAGKGQMISAAFWGWGGEAESPVKAGAELGVGENIAGWCGEMAPMAPGGANSVMLAVFGF